MWRRGVVLAVTGSCLALSAAAAFGQTPAPRQLAANEPDPLTPGFPIWEPSIAVGDDRVVTAYIVGGSPLRIGYSIWDISLGKGTQGIILGPGGADSACDPSVVYDPTHDEFFVLARSGSKIRLAKLASGATQFTLWTNIVDPQGPFQPRNDKPWLLRGELTAFGREYYATYWNEGGFWYLRSTDSGQTWKGDQILIDGQQVLGWPIAMQPTVFDARALFAVYVKEQDGIDGAELRFVRGTDDSDDPNAPYVSFQELRLPPPPGLGPIPPDEDGGPLVVNLKRGYVNFPPVAFQAPGTFQIQTVPWLVADPTSASRLYLVYQDTATSDPNDADVNVYCQVLAKNSATQWTVGSRVQVNDALATVSESDQFLPVPYVDDVGTLHVIYYDDRRFTDPNDPNAPPSDAQPDGSATAFPKFDVYYAFSTNNGLTFEEGQLLFGNPPLVQPNEAVLSLAVLDGWPFGKIGEYVGMAGFGDDIWTAYTGSSRYELTFNPDSNPNVIWSSRIDLGP